MNRTVNIAAIACIAAATPAHAAVTSPLAQGWLDRAADMRAHGNPAGAFDQSHHLLTSGVLLPDLPDLPPDYIEAISALRSNRIETAERLLTRFTDGNRASHLRHSATAGLAAIDINRRQYAAALARYNTIPADAFTGESGRELTLNRAYCMMMLGDYTRARDLFNAVGTRGDTGADATFYLAYLDYIAGNHSNARRLFAQADRTRQPGASAPFYEMEMDYADGKNEAALETAQRLLDNPSTPPVFIPESNRIAGETLYTLGRESQALPYLWKYAAAAPSPAPSAFYILGVAEYEAGHTDEAIKLLQRAVGAENAMGQSANLYLGQAYLRRGDNDSALMAFEKAYRMSYDRNVSETAFYNYAVARMDGGRIPFGSSVGMLEDFLSQYPDSRYATRVRQYLVEGYMSQNDYEAALRALDSVRRTSPELKRARQRVLFVLGSREYTAGNYTSARAHLAEAVTINSDPSVTNQSRLWLGDCLYKLGDYNGAASAYIAFIDHCGPDTDPYNRALALYGLGYARFAAGNYSAALTNFDRAVRAGQSGVLDKRALADANNRAGDCLYYSSKLPEALKRYSDAYTLYPGSGDYAMFQTAVVEGLLGNHTSKINRIDRLINDFPETGLVPSALLEKAESQLALNRRDDAIATYRQLVGHHSATAPGRNGYLQLALTYINAGRRDDAIATYKEIITLYPSSDEASLAADDLKRLYAADGKLDQYVSFINTIPDAPRIDTGEIERLTFEAAEQAYAASGDTSRLEDFVDRYPRATATPQALYYLAESAWNAGNAPRAAALAAQLTETFPHAEAAEPALLIKAEAEMAEGKYERALESLRDLEQQASSAATLHDARMGILRATDALGRSKETLATADILLASSAANSGDTPGEISFMRAKALDRLGHKDQARDIWKTLSRYPANLYGSMSAVYLGQSQLDSGQTDAAKKTVDSLIEANPPHSYWLARGFILYSDILSRQGKDFEAREYLRSLRSNYPGKESDIFEMINQRLNK